MLPHRPAATELRRPARDLRAALQLPRHLVLPTPTGWFEPHARAAGAELAVVPGLPGAERRLAAAASTADENDWATACLAAVHLVRKPANHSRKSAVDDRLSSGSTWQCGRTPVRPGIHVS
jgi:hypothetical protein